MSQDRAESLDDDELGGSWPPDEAQAVDEYGTTGAEQATPEPLDVREAREEPEDLPPPSDGFDLEDPAAGGLLDDEAEAVASGGPDDLGALDDGDPLSGDASLRDVATELEGGSPAEIAAMHLEGPEVGA